MVFWNYFRQTRIIHRFLVLMLRGVLLANNNEIQMPHSIRLPEMPTDVIPITIYEVAGT